MLLGSILRGGGSVRRTTSLIGIGVLERSLWLLTGRPLVGISGLNAFQLC